MPRRDVGALQPPVDEIRTQPWRELLRQLLGLSTTEISPSRATIRTTGATATVLFQIPLDDNAMTAVRVIVVARRTGGSAGTAGDGASYERHATVSRISAGAAAQIGSTTNVHTAESQSGWDCAIDVTGNDVRVQVTGAANNNVTWHGVLIRHLVQS